MLTVAANVLIDGYNSQDTSPMDIIFCSPQILKGRIENMCDYTIAILIRMTLV